LYLKNQKLDRPFDEQVFFNEAKRVLKKDGFIVLFGRGTSFYRWNCILADMGFIFKEEFVWDKSYSTSPLMAISRVHETISIHTKGKGKITKAKVPYLEMKGHDTNAICVDLKRFLSGVKNEKSLKAVLGFLENNRIEWKEPTVKFRVATSGEYKDRDNVVSITKGIRDGLNEKSIIKQNREHYSTIHPTQKPPRLIERLLALVTKEGDLVLDPFSGSGATAIACINSSRKYIGIEIDEGYFLLSQERVKEHSRQGRLEFW
jgi:site-specific DNA-methyltransferase (adenine-specific)